MARWTTAFLAATLFGAHLLGAPAVLPDRDRPGELVGVVSFHCHTEPYFFLEDDKDNPWRVEFSSQDAIAHVVAGDRVKVRGIFPKRATTPRMRDATVEVVGKGVVPPYIEMTPAEMHAVGPDGEPGKRFWYGKLVSTSGVVLDINRRETYTQLVIGPKETPVIVYVPHLLNTPLPEELEIGAHVRVRGVGVYTAAWDEKSGAITPVRDIQVRTASIESVTVLSSKPFWTAGKVFGALGALVAVMLLAVGAVQRARMRDRIAADAVRRERLRLTSELHGAWTGNASSPRSATRPRPTSTS